MFSLNEINFNISYLYLSILGLLVLIQIARLCFNYGKLMRYKKVNQEDTLLPPLSIIISAYNEEDNIKKILPIILEQNYPVFEVIVINDSSDDETLWVLSDFEKRYPNLRKINIEEHIRLKHEKKFTLTIGIKGSKYDHLVFTEPDCEPNSNQWLKGIAEGFHPEKEIVLGYAPFFKTNGFLNKFVRFDNTIVSINYLAAALNKKTYMGVGRNLAYTKDLFFKGKGFNTHMHIKSGDDDLFVNHNATKSNVGIAIAPEEHVYSKGPSTFRNFITLHKKRLLAKDLYKSRGHTVSGYLFYLVLIVGVVLYPNLWVYLTAAYALRLSIQFILFSKIFQKLAVKDLLIWLPFLEIIYYLYMCIFTLVNLRKR